VDNQFDCPPHALLVNVSVPEEYTSCITAEMDISWRIMLVNSCGESVPVQFALRYNDQTRSMDQLQNDYLALAGLDQEPLDTISEVGLFVAVKKTGSGKLAFGDEVIEFGYGCWDCLPDTRGPNEPLPIFLDDEGISHFNGPETHSSSILVLPGLVFPMPRPELGTDPFKFESELEITTDTVIWVGRYDVLK